MGRNKYARTWDATAAERTITKIDRGPSLSAAGQEHIRRTGSLHKFVDPLSGPRISHNAHSEPVDGKYPLTNGPALSIVSFVDGTGSYRQYFERSHKELSSLYGLMSYFNKRYNTQLSMGIVQDVGDYVPETEIRRAVYQTMWESNEAILDQIQQLRPAFGGGDSTEDYQLAMLQLLLNNDVDAPQFYGLPFYSFITGDEIGRDSVNPTDALEHLGITLQGPISTVELGRQLAGKTHLFYLSVGGGAGAVRWWSRVLGQGKVIVLPSEQYLAETQAATIFCYEEASPTRNDVIDFLLANRENDQFDPIDKAGAEAVWKAIERAGIDFGAQTRYPNFDKLPKVGDLFDDPRNPWPIGHEFYTPFGEGINSVSAALSASIDSPIDDAIDWGQL